MKNEWNAEKYRIICFDFSEARDTPTKGVMSVDEANPNQSCALAPLLVRHNRFLSAQLRDRYYAGDQPPQAICSRKTEPLATQKREQTKGTESVCDLLVLT